jgi:hypothetical protein
MAAEDNKAVIRRYIEEPNRRNLAIVDELVAPSLRETVRRGYHRNVTAFPDYAVEIGAMIAEGDQVVVEWMHGGVHRGAQHLGSRRSLAAARADSRHRDAAAREERARLVRLWFLHPEYLDPRAAALRAGARGGASNKGTRRRRRAG